MLISAKGAEHARKQERHVAYSRGAGAEATGIRPAARKRTNPKSTETPIPCGPNKASPGGIPAGKKVENVPNRRAPTRRRRAEDNEQPAEILSRVRSMDVPFVLTTEVESLQARATHQEVRVQRSPLSPVSSMHACTTIVLQARVGRTVRRDRAKRRTATPARPRVGDASVWFPARPETSAGSTCCDRGGILAPASVALQLERPPSTRFLAPFAALESMETVTSSLPTAQSITAIAILSTAKSLHSPPTWNKTWAPCASS